MGGFGIASSSRSNQGRDRPTLNRFREVEKPGTPSFACPRPHPSRFPRPLEARTRVPPNRQRPAANAPESFRGNQRHHRDPKRSRPTTTTTVRINHVVRQTTIETMEAAFRGRPCDGITGLFRVLHSAQGRPEGSVQSASICLVFGRLPAMEWGDVWGAELLHMDFQAFAAIPRSLP